jgi:glycine C-acetyltransferase/8-amino-7-oxononanoate synthase
MFDTLLGELDAQHLTRRLTELSTGVAPVVKIDGQEVLLLASNDYLGLAGHPDIIDAAAEATRRYGVGSGASRLVSGTLPPHRDMERALARFKKTASALAFGSGYLANLGTIPALIGRGGLILADRLCHASLIDACRLSGADFRVYHHNDLAHLATLLSRRKAVRRTLVVTDGVFSMDGDVAPLPELFDLARRYDAELYVDDAHGTGVMGETGRGTLEHFHLEDAVPFHMGTLSKAVGCIGGFVAGTEPLVTYLLNTSRSFMYTTAPPPGAAAAVIAALGIIQREPERRQRLWANRDRLCAGLNRLGFSIGASASPIIPIIIGRADRALVFAKQLLLNGVFAPAIRPPTVPESTSRIRVTITSEHTPTQIDQALVAFQRAGESILMI